MSTLTSRSFAHRAFRRAATVVAACALGAGALSAHAAADGIRQFTAGAHFYKRVVTNTNPQTTSTTVFANLPGASTRVTVPPLTSVLVNVDFDAETRCSGGGAGQNWCELRVLIGAAEGNPMASTFGPDTFAMDSTDSGNNTAGHWASHAFSRHACFTNTANVPVQLPVTVQWKVTNFGGTPEFWVDDSSLVVQLARGCSLTEITPLNLRAADLPATPAQR